MKYLIIPIYYVVCLWFIYLVYAIAVTWTLKRDPEIWCGEKLDWFLQTLNESAGFVESEDLNNN